jgi:hypothetical protein
LLKYENIGKDELKHYFRYQCVTFDEDRTITEKEAISKMENKACTGISMFSKELNSNSCPI